MNNRSIAFQGEFGAYSEEVAFYLDFEGHYKEKIVSMALEILKHNSLFIKIIGSYPKAKEDFSKE